MVSRGQRNGSPGRYFGFLNRSRYFFIQVVSQLSSRGWVDPVPDTLLLRKSGSTGNRTRDLWICSQELWTLDHGGYWKTKVCVNTVHTREELWRRIQQISSELNNTRRIFETCKFLFHPDLSRESVNVEATWSSSCKEVKMKGLLIALTFCVHTVRRIEEVFEVWPWIMKLDQR
jgi:hypothetical protein